MSTTFNNMNKANPYIVLMSISKFKGINSHYVSLVPRPRWGVWERGYHYIYMACTHYKYMISLIPSISVR